MQAADPRKGKAVQPFRFAVGVMQMQGLGKRVVGRVLLEYIL